MPTATGSRAAHKLATRRALQEAANRLFAERGYAATTVREIADAAGVTERTFFRYFTGKGDLVVDDALEWLPVFQEAIQQRPAGEDPLRAVREALRDVAATLRRTDRPTPLWLLQEPPASARANRATGAAMLKVEAGLADALRRRIELSGNLSVIDTEYLADILARTALALVRSALIRLWQLSDLGEVDGKMTRTLIDQAFSVVNVSLGWPVPREPDKTG